MPINQPSPTLKCDAFVRFAAVDLCALCDATLRCAMKSASSA
jgi:hypothetical protein